jgi:acetyltransferase-like isoleucine patch superfamily enzyme
MKSFFRNICYKIFDRFHIIHEKYLENRLRSKVLIHINSRIYSSSKVYNLSEKKELINIDENTHIKGELLIFKFGGEIKIGANCYIGEGTRIWSAENIEIGNNVLVSHNVNIIDTNSHEIDHQERSEGYISLLKNGHAKTQGSIISKSILIKNYAWINFNAVILKGVTIGEGAIVAAGSVVTKDVPDFTMVAGNPAKIIKQLK